MLCQHRFYIYAPAGVFLLLRGGMHFAQLGAFFPLGAISRTFYEIVALNNSLDLN
jgi:hypothetical protein